jgi:two-component system cell cycle response regulator
VLRQIAARALDSVRSVDLVARLGGEEFAVVMPETSLAVAAAVADRLRLAVASEPFVLGPDGERLPITVSIGATTTIAGGNRDQLLKRADDALYEAKSAGRNRVVAHPAKLGRRVDSRPRRPVQVGW